MVQDGLVRKLKALMASRVLFATVILGSFLAFDIGYDVFPYPRGVQYLIIALYSLTFVYTALLNRVPSQPFAYAQVCIDSLAGVALIFFTGGVESWFTWLLLLIVLEAAIVVSRRAGFTVAVLGGLLYGLLVNLQYHGIIILPYDPSLGEKDFLYKLFTVITGLLLTAYLAGLLVSRLERKDIVLRELALFNREVIENTPSGLFTTDTQGIVKLFNRAAEEVTGLSRDQAVGSPVSRVFPFITHLAEQRRMEETVTLAGEECVIGCSISLIRNARGDHTGYIGVFQDLTEVKKLAETVKRKEKMAAIGELSANMAHEIRNPLASLKGSMEMLREGALGHEQRERLMAIALSEMDRLNTIITDFLSYSRPMELQVRKFNLHTVLGQTLELLANRGTPDISFCQEFHGPDRIAGDPQRLQQVFWNLGLNALDAMPDGGELSVDTSARNGTVHIRFRDTGTGIAPEDLARVMDPFYTTRTDGVGLGLSIAYRIVEEHRGALSIESTLGRGTTFDIQLPAAP